MAARAGAPVSGRPRKFLQGLVDELTAFAERIFALARAAGDGASEGDHLVSARRQWERLGRKAAADRTAADLPSFPEPLRYLWDWFVELHDGCGSNGFAVQTTWQDLAAWSAATGNVPAPWEARVLIRLGAAAERIESEAATRRLKQQRKA